MVGYPESIKHSFLSNNINKQKNEMQISQAKFKDQTYKPTVIVITSIDCSNVLDTLTVRTHLISTIKLTRWVPLLSLFSR